jgi:hypothetical protein
MGNTESTESGGDQSSRSPSNNNGNSQDVSYWEMFKSGLVFLIYYLNSKSCFAFSWFSHHIHFFGHIFFSSRFPSFFLFFYLFIFTSFSNLDLILRLQLDSKEMLVNAIIRPPRANYDTGELGPRTFLFCDKLFERSDLELKNSRNQTLKVFFVAFFCIYLFLYFCIHEVSIFDQKFCIAFLFFCVFILICFLNSKKKKNLIHKRLHLKSKICMNAVFVVATLSPASSQATSSLCCVHAWECIMSA